MPYFKVTILVGLITLGATHAAAGVTGPIIEDYGPVFYTKPLDVKTPTDREYMGLFELSGGFVEGRNTINAGFNSVARFLNMHAQVGVPKKGIGAALIVHGNATHSALSNKKYRELFGVGNPNTKLLKELKDKGVLIAQCAQSATVLGFTKGDMAVTVDFYLSAMTAMAIFQQDGYLLVSIEA